MIGFLARKDYTNRDRLLPSQPAMQQLFSDGPINFYPALEGITNSVLSIQSVHDKFDIQLAPGMTYETLGSDLSTLHFLQLLVRLTGAKHILEIGTYIGVATMFLAEAAGQVREIVTFEIGANFVDLAETNLRRNQLRDGVVLVNADARNMLGGEPWPFDLVFLDGSKEHYDELLPRCLDVLRPGGLLVIDDVFCNGDTLNIEPTTDKGRGVRRMLEQMRTLQDHSPVILPYGDGLLLLRKPEKT